jgi:hypothetical protein
MTRTAPLLVLAGLVLACSSGPPAALPVPEAAWTEVTTVNVRVTLDGAPVVAEVGQGGTEDRVATDRDGLATISVDPTLTGDIVVVANHADARLGGTILYEPPLATVTVALTRFDPTDNPAYVFADPGPEDFDASTTADCLHCHVTLHEDWETSVHATAARDEQVTDLYQGVSDLGEADCAAAGGTWGDVEEPGSDTFVARCIVTESVLEATDGFGGCADCHAPGIDGALGGRDLLEASGVSFESGVHCDVCHKVESVDLDTTAPGVAGALRILRPSEVSPSPVLGDWRPLSFGPFDDVLNPVMGSVAREHFHTGELCAGCHEHAQPVLVRGAEIDRGRWPDGLLPIQTTWSEWEGSAYDPSAPCQSCHMPPDGDVGNAADLYNLFDDVDVGVSAGWERPAGEVRRHLFAGPRSEEIDLLGLAADLTVATTSGDTLSVDVTVENVGPGHALPTGEPLRNLLLLVDVRCDGAPLDPIGGDIVPALGGALETHASIDGATVWAGATVGDQVRFVRATGAWVDYTGFGSFGDGTFSAEQKGLPELVAAGTSTIVAITDGVATLSPEAPAEWDEAFRVPATDLPADGEPALPRAGSAGFSFAKVLIGADGAEMVPHHLAVDVARDNRLLPGTSWTTHHTFPACDAPDVRVALVHRAWPWELADARGWPLVESVVEAR